MQGTQKAPECLLPLSHMRAFVGAVTSFAVKQHNMERNLNPLVLYTHCRACTEHTSQWFLQFVDSWVQQTLVRVHQKEVLV